MEMANVNSEPSHGGNIFVQEVVISLSMSL